MQKQLNGYLHFKPLLSCIIIVIKSKFVLPKQRHQITIIPVNENVIISVLKESFL